MCACKPQISSQTLKATDKHADCCALMCPDSCTLSWHSKCTQMRTHGHETGNFLLLANLAIPRPQVHTGSKLCALKEKKTSSKQMLTEQPSCNEQHLLWAVLSILFENNGPKWPEW